MGIEMGFTISHRDKHLCRQTGITDVTDIRDKVMGLELKF